MITLETDRLIIRNFTPDDWPQLQELAIAYRNSKWAQYEDPWPTSDEEVKGMATWFAGGDGYLATCLKDTGKLIGMIAIERRENVQGRVHNLGYVFHPAHHGYGYATEGCRAAMAYLFGPLAADSIYTGTNPDNEESVRLLKRLGLKEKEDARGKGARGEFTISREEWLALEKTANWTKKESEQSTVARSL
ncbi:MAG: GNAT family N-acetyltransferase [Anaerolineae bacterium]|nr:GNAT family N-acetyltransferase [Anaerolineae bacterium]